MRASYCRNGRTANCLLVPRGAARCAQLSSAAYYTGHIKPLVLRPRSILTGRPSDKALDCNNSKPRKAEMSKHQTKRFRYFNYLNLLFIKNGQVSRLGSPSWYCIHHTAAWLRVLEVIFKTSRLLTLLNETMETNNTA